MHSAGTPSWPRRLAGPSTPPATDAWSDLPRRLRFTFRGWLRLLRPVRLDAPLPRPTHDF